MLNEKLSGAADAVSSAIRQTEEYEDYIRNRKLANSDPTAKELIEKARSLQNRLMDIPEEERNSDYAESLLNEYEEIAENTAVYEYSRAEAIYMTLLQEVLGRIIEGVDIDV